MTITDPLGNTLDDLAGALKSRNPYRRREAVEGLSAMDGGGGLLFDVIEDPNPHVRAAVARCARRLDPDLASALLSVLVNDTSAHVCADALESIGSLGIDTLAPAAINAAARSADPRVRSAGVRACGLLGVDTLPQIVAAALNDPNRQVRLRGAEVARAGADPAYTAQLIGLLDQEAAEDEVHEGMVAGLAQAVAACGGEDPAIGTVLARALTACSESKPIVAKAIAKLRCETARPALEALLAAPEAINRSLAVRTLGEIGVGSSIGLIRAMADDRDPAVVHAALRALGGGEHDNAIDRIRIAVRCVTDGIEILQGYANGEEPAIANVAADALTGLRPVLQPLTD